MKNLLTVSAFAALIFVMFIYGGSPSESNLVPDNSKQELKHMPWLNSQTVHSGDLIFRRGKGFISESLRSLNLRDRKYSHAGIIKREGDSLFVYHAIGGEQNKTNRLRRDPLESFCRTEEAYGFGIYRTDLDPKQLDQVMSVTEFQYRSGLEFDTRFDLASDDKMYCTEFIYKVFKSVLGDSCFLSLSAFSGVQYVGCDDLYLNTHCQLIYSHSY